MTYEERIKDISTKLAISKYEKEKSIPMISWDEIPDFRQNDNKIYNIYF